MSNNELFELVVSTKDVDFICHPIITEYQKQQQIETDDFELVHIVYTIHEDKPIVFYIRFINSITELPKESFYNYITQIKKASFNELLYLVSYYGFFQEDEDNLSLIKDNNSIGAVASYLECTNGKLLYHYQVEQLYSSITNSTVEEAIAFRKSINLKRPSAFEKAKTMLLPSGESLFEVLIKYRFRDFTLYPKIKEAIALYNYLNQ